MTAMMATTTSATAMMTTGAAMVGHADEHPRRRRRIVRGARQRILASYLILLVGSTVLTDIALREVLLSRVEERVDRSLSQEVEEFRRLVRDGRDPRNGEPFGANVRAIFDVFLARNVPGEGEALFTYINGELYRSSSSAPVRTRLLREIEGLSRTGKTVRDQVQASIGEVRYLAVPVRVEGRSRGVFVVTTALRQEREEVTDALRIAVFTSLGVLALASLIAFLVAGRVLAPLRGLRDTARSISDTDLTRRIPAEGQDEIADLARTFNSMLDRLEQAFASQKDFVSDAGHELRTPITIIRGHLELMGDDPVERHETVELVTDELERMSRFVDDLLLLAKARRPDFLQAEALDLDDFARGLCLKAQALAPREWQLEATGAHGRIVADRQRLTQAVMNLATNAARHTAPGDPIEIGAELDGGYARLWVRDSGPGVPAVDRERIFERFAQADGNRRRADGAGLGLAIVRAIAEAHGGQVELDTIEGRGSRFTVIIPEETKAEA